MLHMDGIALAISTAQPHHIHNCLAILMCLLNVHPVRMQVVSCQVRTPAITLPTICWHTVLMPIGDIVSGIGPPPTKFAMPYQMALPTLYYDALASRLSFLMICIYGVLPSGE